MRAGFVLFSSVACCLTVARADRKDVLFIAIDDLRPSLGAYGANYVKTPHIDALASRSMTFQRAYTAVSVCAPARTAIMVGRRPDTTKSWMISGHEYCIGETVVPNATSLPQYFNDSGYITIGMGKLFHPGVSSFSLNIVSAQFLQ